MSPYLELVDWIFLFIVLSGIALLLRALSRKIGEALHMKKYYFLYDASVLLFGLSVAVILLNFPGGAWALPGMLLFSVGALLMVGTTIRYWGWILPEMLMQDK